MMAPAVKLRDFSGSRFGLPPLRPATEACAAALENLRILREEGLACDVASGGELSDIQPLSQLKNLDEINAEVSQTAGTFVCNHVFYGLMHLLADWPNPLGVPWIAGRHSLHLWNSGRCDIIIVSLAWLGAFMVGDHVWFNDIHTLHAINFVRTLPIHAWLIRAGLYLYDSLARRDAMRARKASGPVETTSVVRSRSS